MPSPLPSASKPGPRRLDFSRLAFIALWGCLLLGLGCRFYGLDWDEGAQLHPDERFCLSIVQRLAFPQSLAQFFDSSRSPLSPAVASDAHYVYGQLPLFLLFGAAKATGTTDPHTLLLLGRFLAALFDCGTVVLAFLLGKRWFDARAGVFSAALVACAALHIQQSHFFVVDPFAAFFTTATLWASARLIAKNRGIDALLLGVCFGAALACKISAALFGVALLGFLLIFARRHRPGRALFCAFVVIFSAFVTFRLAHPMAFRGAFGFFDLRPDPRFWGDLIEQSAITRGEVDVPFNVQWIGRTPILYSLRNLGFWGYGWPLLLSAGVGLALLIRRPRGHAFLLVAAFFALTLLGVQGAAFSKFTRYYLPMTPVCALLTAHAWREIEKKKGILRLGTPLVALSAAAWALCVTSIYGRPHTRIAASRWIAENVAPGTAIGNESTWDDGLPIGTLGLHTSFRWVDLDLHALDTPAKATDLAQKLDTVQWIFISSGRGWQNIPRWEKKWPLTTHYYRALFQNRLGFRLEKRFDSFPRFGPLQFPDADAEEALTVYDHPLVLLFHKTPKYDSGEVRRILDSVACPESQPWQPNLAAIPDGRYLPVPPGF